MIFTFSIKGGKVVMTYTSPYDRQIQVTYDVDSVYDAEKFLHAKAQEIGVRLQDLIITFSSGMDFPEEHTTDPETIKLVRQLRNGE